MNKIEEIKKLTNELLYHCHLYYDLDKPIISDAEYDRKFDTLKQLEDETGFWLANSPTRMVQGKVLDGFTKITHSKPMLSAAKTKNPEDIKKFLGNNVAYCSWKLDGLTLVVIYENGEFVQAITRGTGLVGEDVTEQAKMIKNLPMHINYYDRLELRGECVVDWDTFNSINETLEEPYSHPRNLAAGSLRNLDTNITKQRGLSYIVFECVSYLDNEKLTELEMLEKLGFETVETTIGYKNNATDVDFCIAEMNPEGYKYPVDGLIFEIESKAISKAMPSTAHHESCRIALKWADNIYETTLRDVEWNTTRSGIIAPVAVFDEIDLDGALTTRATLHNLSIIEQLQLGIGDTITIYRSNMVIPKIDDNLTRSNTLHIPHSCPCCGAKTEIKHTDNSKVLMCTNPNCTAKKIAQFTHFVSRKCMNIDGLSEKSLETLISHGFLHSYKDIYHLSDYRNELICLDGWGEKSVNNMLNSIEKSRNIKLENFIAALGIPNIGGSAAKTISKAFNGDHYDFIQALSSGYDFTQLEDFGEVMNQSLHDWWNNKDPMVELLPMELNFIQEESTITISSKLIGKNICVTGALKNFTRDSINAKIESIGAKPVGSVSKKTDYLITNEISGSSKYKKAIELGIPVITEDEFINMIS